MSRGPRGILAALLLLSFLGPGCQPEGSSDSPSLDVLADVLTSGSPADRRWAACQIAARAPRALGPRGRVVRRALISVLGRADDDPDVRVHAVLALGACARGDSEAVDALFAHQIDATPSVAAMATRAIGMLGLPRERADTMFLDPVPDAGGQEGRLEWVATHVAQPSEAPGELRVTFAWRLVRRLRPGQAAAPGGGAAGWIWVASPAAPLPGTSLTWRETLSVAQQEARRDGKLLLVASRQPGCGLCERLPREVAETLALQIQSMAVCYMLDARNPEAPAVWQMLRAYLPRARLMPLVGILSPDLQWITGFGGPPSVEKLRSALEQAQRLRPRPGPRRPTLDDWIRRHLASRDAPPFRAVGTDEAEFAPYVGQTWQLVAKLGRRGIGVSWTKAETGAAAPPPK